MSFKAFDLSNTMINSLSRQGYVNPSKVQERVIARILKNESLLVQSETGSGKTHAFLIPLIDRINYDLDKLQVIIVAPTRELARQIYDFAMPFTKEFNKLKIRLAKAGEEIEATLKGLSVAPHILIGTPGRLADILSNKNALALSFVTTVVFDEADMLLKEGYFKDIDRFVFLLNSPRFLVFSATLENNLENELEKYIGSRKLLLCEETMTSHTVKHHLIDIRHEDVCVAAENFINYKKPYLLLIFASKKDTVNDVYNHLKTRFKKVGLLTGDLSSRERKNVMKELKNENIHILVCSDMAARGLDISDVSDVLNIDLPNNLEFYYHRAGRTGRFNKVGDCYSFYNNDATLKAKTLISDGVNFDYFILKNNELIEGHALEEKRKPKKVDEELKKEIAKVNRKPLTKKGKVKPGYKKKRKEEIDKVKRKYRREMIKKDIRRQRVERYKKEGRNNG